MASIITHPGSAHLDDFLSCCLLLHKSGDIDIILRKEPSDEEIQNPALWKLDVGERYDPARRCFDHHKNQMTNDCTLSLLLKHWGLWNKAEATHQWLRTAVLQDTHGSQAVIEQLGIPSEALGALDSFIKRTVLDMFGEQQTIRKGDLLFRLMEQIGDRFFFLIGQYESLPALMKPSLEFKELKGVPVGLCYKGLEPAHMLLRLLKERMRERWPEAHGGIVVLPNNRIPGTLALKRLADDPRVDFTRIAHYEKVIYAHDSGFYVSVHPMSDYELDIYIKDAIRD